MGAPALAQDDQGFGLDLSDEAQKKEQDETERKETEANRPALTPPPATDADKAAAAANAMIGERDITQDDRVKAVQRKVYLRTGRFELTPLLSASVNDPFVWKFSAAMKVGFYFADTLAVSGRFSLITTLRTDDERLAKQAFGRILRSIPQWSAMGDLEWSPVYGKVAIFNSILHFDAFVTGGLGVVYTETSSLPDRIPNPAADLGGGVRFQIYDHLAAGVSVINTTYVDQPLGTTKGTTQNIVSLMAGMSVFFPFRSTGREAE
jgi:outer membrane beta-barrel protein